MEKVCAGDRESYRKLYEKYRRPIMSFLNTIVKDPDIADELFQDTFLKLYRARETYEKRAKFTTFLWTIAKHTAFDWIEKKKEISFEPFSFEDGSPVPGIEESLESELPDAEQALMDRLDDRAIQDCLNRLSDRDRLICSLRMHSELSYDEIAEQLNLPVGTVKTKLHRLRGKLMHCFQSKTGRTA